MSAEALPSAVDRPDVRRDERRVLQLWSWELRQGLSESRSYSKTK